MGEGGPRSGFPENACIFGGSRHAVDEAALGANEYIAKHRYFVKMVRCFVAFLIALYVSLIRRCMIVLTHKFAVLRVDRSEWGTHIITFCDSRIHNLKL